MAMPRSYDGVTGAERYHPWPQSHHYYDDRQSPMHFSYAEGRAVGSTSGAGPDRLLQDSAEVDPPASNSTRRRIAVAVCLSFSYHRKATYLSLTCTNTTYSVLVVESVRSSAAATEAMVWAAKIAEVQV